MKENVEKKTLRPVGLPRWESNRDPQAKH